MAEEKITLKQNPENNTDQSVYISDLDEVRAYPREMSNDEIDFDIQTSVRKRSPEQYYEEAMPMKEFLTSWSMVGRTAAIEIAENIDGVPILQGMKAIQKVESEFVTPAMKLVASDPLYALGITKETTPEVTANTYKPWVQLWRESEIGGAATEVSDKLLADAPLPLAAVPWFFSEFLPEELLEFGTKPSAWVTALGVEKIGGAVLQDVVKPWVMNKLLPKLSKGVQEALFKDFWGAEKELSKDFKILGLKKNAKFSEVKNAYRNAVNMTHPDKGGDPKAFKSVVSAYKNIMRSRADAFAKASQRVSKSEVAMKLLTSQKGSANLIPSAGDMVIVGKETGKLIKKVGEIAFVNVAGKIVEVPFEGLKLKNPPPEKKSGKTKTVGYRVGSKEGEAGAGTFYALDPKKINKALSSKGAEIKKTELEFENLLEIPESELQGYKGTPSEYLASKWIKGSNFDTLNEGAKMDKAVAKEAIKRGYDGIKYGDGEIQDLRSLTQKPGELSEESAINLSRIKTTPKSAANLKKATNILKEELEGMKGSPITHEEVLEKAKEADILSKGVSREQTLEFQASLLKTRQHMAQLAEQNELTPEFLDALKVTADLGTDIARNLESFKIEAIPEYAATKMKLIKNLMKLGVESEDILQAAKGVDFKNEMQVAKFYRQFVKPTVSEMLDEFVYANILSSPKTHIVNIFSNFLQLAGLNPATKLASGAIDFIASKLTGRQRTHYINEVVPFVKGALNAVPDALKGVQQIMAGNKNIERPDVQHLPTLSKAVDIATLGLGKYITRALEASDVFFRSMVTAGEVEAASAKLGRDPTEKELIKIKKEAAKKGEYYVFRTKPDADNKTKQGHVLSWIDKVTTGMYQLRRVPGFKWFIRFVQTPMNILKQGIEYSPAGFATLPGAGDKTEQAGKAAIGSLVFAGAAWMAATGNTTWSAPKGENDKKAFYDAGMQPYSVRVGDKWVSYSKLGPISYPIAMASAFLYFFKESPKALSDSELEKLTDGIGGVLGFLSDQSYMRGLNDLVSASKGEKPRALAGLATQLISLSSLQGWVNSIIDPIVRKTEKGLTIESVIDQVKMKIIGLSQTVKPETDPRRRPAKRQLPLINAISPLSISEVSKGKEKRYQKSAQMKQVENLNKKRAEERRS